MSNKEIKALLDAVVIASMRDLMDASEKEAGQLAAGLLEISQKAQKVDYKREEWAAISKFAGQALANIKITDAGSAHLDFFWLGFMFRQILGPDDEELSGLTALAAEAIARRQPIEFANWVTRVVKGRASMIAQSMWDRDTANTRIGSMAELVWIDLVGEISQITDEEVRKQLLGALPDQASGIRSWIANVAPEYARKGGRPKKK